MMEKDNEEQGQWVGHSIVGARHEGGEGQVVEGGEAELPDDGGIVCRHNLLGSTQIRPRTVGPNISGPICLEPGPGRAIVL